LNPNHPAAIFLRVQLYARQGNYNKIVSDFCQGIWESNKNDIQEIPVLHLSVLGRIYAQVGHRNEAVNMLTELIRRIDEGKYVEPQIMGYLYNALEENEKAIDYFELSSKETNPYGYWINVELIDNSIYSDERFKEVLRKMGIER
jgi:tetratricopeptide (TPR) repeat protein